MHTHSLDSCEILVHLPGSVDGGGDGEGEHDVGVEEVVFAEPDAHAQDLEHKKGLQELPPQNRPVRESGPRLLHLLVGGVLELFAARGLYIVLILNRILVSGARPTSDSGSDDDRESDIGYGSPTNPILAKGVPEMYVGFVPYLPKFLYHFQNPRSVYLICI